MNFKYVSSLNRRTMAFGLAVFSLAFFALTQAVLTIAPTDFNALKTGWKLVGVDKSSWHGLNFWFGIMFMLSLLCCCISARHPNPTPQPIPQTRRLFRIEYAIILTLCALVIIGVLIDTPPLRTFYNLTLLAKRSW